MEYTNKQKGIMYDQRQAVNNMVPCAGVRIIDLNKLLKNPDFVACQGSYELADLNVALHEGARYELCLSDDETTVLHPITKDNMQDLIGLDGNELEDPFKEVALQLQSWAPDVKDLHSVELGQTPDFDALNAAKYQNEPGSDTLGKEDMKTYHELFKKMNQEFDKAAADKKLWKNEAERAYADSVLGDVSYNMQLGNNDLLSNGFDEPDSRHDVYKNDPKKYFQRIKYLSDPKAIVKGVKLNYDPDHVGDTLDSYQDVLTDIEEEGRRNSERQQLQERIVGIDGSYAVQENGKWRVHSVYQAFPEQEPGEKGFGVKVDDVDWDLIPEDAPVYATNWSNPDEEPDVYTKKDFENLAKQDLDESIYYPATKENISAFANSLLSQAEENGSHTFNDGVLEDFESYPEEYRTILKTPQVVLEKKPDKKVDVNNVDYYFYDKEGQMPPVKLGNDLKSVLKFSDRYYDEHDGDNIAKQLKIGQENKVAPHLYKSFLQKYGIYMNPSREEFVQANKKSVNFDNKLTNRNLEEVKNSPTTEKLEKLDKSLKKMLAEKRRLER